MPAEPNATRPARERRWMKSVIAAATQPLPALPFQIGARRRPASLGGPQIASTRPGSIAAH